MVVFAGFFGRFCFLISSKEPTSVRTGTSLHVPKGINISLYRIFHSKDKTRKGWGTETLAGWATDSYEILEPQVKFGLWVFRIWLIVKPESWGLQEFVILWLVSEQRKFCLFAQLSLAMYLSPLSFLIHVSNHKSYRKMPSVGHSIQLVIYLQMLPQVLFCQFVLNLTHVGAAGLLLPSSLPWAHLWLLIINLHYHIPCNSCFSLSPCNFPALYPPRKKEKKSGLHKLWISSCHLWSIGL